MKQLINRAIIALIALASFTLTQEVYAQEGGQRGGQQQGGEQLSAEEMLERRVTQETSSLTKALTLTEAQAESVSTVCLKYAKLQAALREDGSSREEQMEKMKEYQTLKTADYKKIFTAEQFTAYEELLKKQEEQRGQRGEGGEGGQRGEGGQGGGRQ
ncbi:MAG: hypothetical protein R3Y04_06300 [Rikenellaceae bacterium]